VRVDLGRFVRVLLNLIKNSVEAMPKGGVLRLELLQLENTAIFRVADTGGGIPPELLPKIFEPFVTYGKSKGTGLGMAIVKSVVEAHGGIIEIRSKVGVGTTVEITLPTLAPESV
jgi:signal transduction histidine kinase